VNSDPNDDRAVDPSEQLSQTEYVPESRWPVVMGTISILYASFGILFMLVTLAGIFLGPWLQASLAGMEPIPVPMVLIIGQSLLAGSGFVLGVILLLGGIMTLKRRRPGPKFITIWVIGRLAVLIVALVFAFATLDLNLKYQERVADEVVEMMRSNNVSEERIQESMPGQSLTRQSMMTWTLVLSGVLAIYPVLTGLTLSGRAVREEVRTWS
jgi:hypothetical protein